MNNKTLTGFTLTELLIALLLGIIVIGSVGSIYLINIKSSSNTLGNSKLNYELSTLMEMMISDMRRAGFNNNISTSEPQTNSFNQMTSTTDVDTALSLRDNMTDDNLITTKASVQNNSTGQCVLYAYDQDLDGSVDNNEVLGFRLNSGVVQIRSAVANAAAIVADTAEDSCSNGTWYDLTDGNLITATALTFSLAASNCLNTTKTDGVDNDSANGIDDAAEINCYNDTLYNDAALAGSGDITVEARVVDITLTAQLAGDANINSTVQNSVRLRNDIVRIR